MLGSIFQLNEAVNNASNTLRGTQINNTRDKMVLLKHVIQSFNQLKRSIKDWGMRYLLQVDIDGTVSFLNFWTKNQQVHQGDVVFTIIPSKNTDYVVKLKTPAQNSGKIKIGQKVNVRLESYPHT